MASLSDITCSTDASAAVQDVPRGPLFANAPLTVTITPYPTVQLKQPPINFQNVEALRKRMLISASNMAKIFGVSRVTYYNWLKGKKPRREREKSIREMTRKLFACVDYHKWISAETLMATQKERMIMLQELLKKLDNGPVSGVEWASTV